MTTDDPGTRDHALTETGGDGWGGAETAGDPDLNGSPAAAADAPAAAEARDDGGPASAPDTEDPAASPAGTESAGRGAAAKPGRKHRSFWRELPVLVIVALVIALVIKTFVVQAFFIPSASMENTLKIGDKVLVNKLVYDFRPIRPGDIIVFNGEGSWTSAPPAPAPSSDPLVRLYRATLVPLLHSIGGLFGTAPGQTDFIKRVIGVSGDRVACCNAHGLVTVNGLPLHEKSYLYPGAAPSDIHFSIVVPKGRLWVMGDNRYVSDDSRLRQGDPGHGTIPANQVVGRAFVIVWPPSRWRFLPIPATFDQPGINRASAASARAASRAESAALTRGIPVAPAAPYLPLAAGFGIAVPLTWLQRTARRRVRRRRPGHR